MVGKSPDSLKYHPYYCEENVWHLCATLNRGWAVFVSNPRRAVFFRNQRLQPSGLVWDYHVVHLDEDGTLTDFDHAYALQQPVAAWLVSSFAEPTQFSPMFRAIAAGEYLAGFASDRSHMMVDGEFRSPPPPWPCIGQGHTLDGFLANDGNWRTLAEFREWIVSWHA